MNIPSDLKYTHDHEWIRVEGDTGVVGITEYAQGELGDIVFVELPAPGDSTTAGEACGSIEAVKAVSDLFAPVSGEVNGINESLEGDPQLVNKDPYGDGWMVKVKLSDPSQLDDLLDAAAYQQLIE